MVLPANVLQGLVARAAEKLDVLHILSVFMNGEPPSFEERRLLEQVSRILSVPVGGDFAWGKIAEFAETRGFASQALPFLNAASVAFELEPVAELLSAKPHVEKMIDAILQRESLDFVKIAAVCHCPACDYTFAVQSE